MEVRSDVVFRVSVCNKYFFNLARGQQE